MALVLGEFTAPESVCMYLPPRMASNQYRTMVEVSAALMAAGNSRSV